MAINRLEEHWSAAQLVVPQVRWQEEDSERSSVPDWLQRVGQFLVDHPQTTVIAALAVGVALGWLGKRK